MKTKEEILSAVIAGKGFKAIDGRDLTRLACFFEDSELHHFGVERKGEQWAVPLVLEFSEAAVLQQLAEDVEFAFRKALDQRGISAGAMNDVIKMWMWVLDDDLQYCQDYAEYGLPLLKRVAVKYGLPSPIGDDNGDEDKYAMDESEGPSFQTVMASLRKYGRP